MGIFDTIREKIQDFSNTTSGNKIKKVFKKIWKVLKKICAKIFHYRAAFLALVVVVCSLIMAVFSMILLPAQVGINLQIDGTYSFTAAALPAVCGGFPKTGQVQRLDTGAPPAAPSRAPVLCGACIALSPCHPA